MSELWKLRGPSGHLWENVHSPMGQPHAPQASSELLGCAGAAACMGAYTDLGLWDLLQSTRLARWGNPGTAQFKSTHQHVTRWAWGHLTLRWELMRGGAHCWL